MRILALGKPALRLLVDCRAGFRGEETPLLLRFGSRTVAVVDVQDRWLAPDHRYFKLLGDDGCQYLVRHDGETGAWELTSFRSAPVTAR